jgi:glutamyl/glutaminyl-tRNA synthetase
MGEYRDELLTKLLPSIIDRISWYGELASIKDSEFGFFLRRPEVDIEKVSYKDDEKSVTAKHLQAISKLLTESTFETPEHIKATLIPYAEEHGKGNVLWPLRVSLSGQEKSIDPFTICYVLGMEECSARIEAVINKLLL